MVQTPNSEPYDLEERTYQFARGCREFVKKLPRTICNIEDGKQLGRSSGSVAANYIEANESVSRKDFALRVKIARKEAKECRLWLRLCEIGDSGVSKEAQKMLITEAIELGKIFGSILEKSR
ncbi:MAG: four helix bundle protein [Acidobacteria bacterium]|nr:four helix bundle protein [Acidobacteriota bacterium]